MSRHLESQGENAVTQRGEMRTKFCVAALTCLSSVVFNIDTANAVNDDLRKEVQNRWHRQTFIAHPNSSFEMPNSWRAFEDKDGVLISHDPKKSKEPSLSLPQSIELKIEPVSNLKRKTVQRADAARSSKECRDLQKRTEIKNPNAYYECGNDKPVATSYRVTIPCQDFSISVNFETLEKFHLTNDDSISSVSYPDTKRLLNSIECK